MPEKELDLFKLAAGIMTVCLGSFFVSLLGYGGGKAGRSFADKPVVTILANCCAGK